MKIPVDIMNSKEWINLREKLKGQWIKNSDWCVKQLRDYLGPINKSDENKLRIVLNYMVGSGFRSGIISSRDNPSIPKLRAEISAELKKRKFKSDKKN